MVSGQLGKSRERCRFGVFACQLRLLLLSGVTLAGYGWDELGDCDLCVCDCGSCTQLLCEGEEDVCYASVFSEAGVDPQDGSVLSTG